MFLRKHRLTASQVLKRHEQKTNPDPIASTLLKQTLEEVLVRVLDTCRWSRDGVLSSDVVDFLQDIGMVFGEAANPGEDFDSFFPFVFFDVVAR